MRFLKPLRIFKSLFQKPLSAYEISFNIFKPSINFKITTEKNNSNSINEISINGN